MASRSRRAFSLVELSIVLVILGLLVGGVLSGRSLITSAALRAQIAQIDQYRTAANTFRSKYNYLPGDLPNPLANQLGMDQYARTYGSGVPGIVIGSYADAGGNGVIDGSSYGPTHLLGGAQYSYEHEVFWFDLATAGLINFKPTGDSVCPQAGSVPLSQLLPAAKIGQNNHVYVWSGGYQLWSIGHNGLNYFGVAAIRSTAAHCDDGTTDTGLTVGQAYSLDKKLDDGLPQTGKVVALYAGATQLSIYAAGPNQVWGPSDTSASAASATSCMDNGNVAGTQNYSLANESAMNCNLSFEF